MSEPVRHSHDRLDPSVRDARWISNCAGEIFLEGDDADEPGVRIGHFQGDATLAAFVVEAHNALLLPNTATTSIVTPGNLDAETLRACAAEAESWKGSKLLLHAGEMSAAEKRTAEAVSSGIAAAFRQGPRKF